MNRWTIGLLIAVLLIAAGASGGEVLARDRASERVERLAASGGGFVAGAAQEQSLVGLSIFVDDGPGDLLYEIDAVVTMPAKKAKGAKCVGFATDRSESDTRTRIAALCRTAKGTVKAPATLSVSSIILNDATSEEQEIDSCRQQRTVKRTGTLLSCSVQNPESPN